jgi:hypothetical protein
MFNATSTRVKRGVAVVAAVAAVGGGAAAALAPSASATIGDPNVTVQGGAGCHAFLTYPSLIQFSLANGESASSKFSLFSYKVFFHAIPENGTSGTATITCGSGPKAYTYVRSVSINRPENGANITVNFPAG